MLIAKIEENIITQISDHRDMFPNVSFSSNGPDDEWLFVNNCKKINGWKEHDQKTETLISCSPYIDKESGMVYCVVVEPKSEEQKNGEFQSLSSKIRFQRNKLLDDSDWTQMPDSSANKEIWLLYRQSLRDITNQEGFPENVIWPEIP